MWVYALLFALPALWASADRLPPRAARLVPPAIGLALALFVGFRRQVGGDWHSYWLMYERAGAYPAADALLVSDPAYMALNLVAASAGLNLALVNLACAALLAAGIVAFCRDRPAPWLALLAATPMLIVVMGMTTTRQSAAIGLELVALAFLLRGRRGAAAAALILAFAFHWSAAILLPLILLARTAERWRPVLLAAAAAAAGLAAAALWLRSGFGALDEPAPGAVFRLFPSLVSVGLLAALRGRLGWARAEWDAAWYLSGLTLFCLAILPVASLPADRLGYYTIPLQMLVFSHLAAALAPRFRRAAHGATFALFATLFAGWAMLGSYTSCMTPYRSYLAAPALLLEAEGPRPMCSAG